MRAANAGAPITIFESEDRGGFLPVRADIRPMSCCWKSGSADGWIDQCDRGAAGDA
jgi:hypothetical protein